MTEAVSKISITAEVGKKNSRDSQLKHGKSVISKHFEETEDMVDISDEARDKSGRGKRKDVLAYLENGD